MLLIAKSLFLYLWIIFGSASLAMAATTYQLPSGEVLHDPTTPKGWGSVNTSKSQVIKMDLTLNYTRISDGNKHAMINGIKVTEGDKIAGVTVTKIKRYSVTLFLNGKHKVLRLNKIASFKQQSGSKKQVSNR